MEVTCAYRDRQALKQQSSIETSLSAVQLLPSDGMVQVNDT